MDGRHPALARLDLLVGRWTAQPDMPGLGSAQVEFSWLEGGMFLRQFTDAEPPPPTAPQEWRDNVPFPTVCLIGLDDATGELTMLYADARGVHRVYRTALADGEWRIWRDAPGFNQRFIGTFSADGNTVTSRWETSKDGETWELDFGITYVREAPTG